jgi:hypothetical protein
VETDWRWKESRPTVLQGHSRQGRQAKENRKESVAKQGREERATGPPFWEGARNAEGPPGNQDGGLGVWEDKGVKGVKGVSGKEQRPLMGTLRPPVTTTSSGRVSVVIRGSQSCRTPAVGGLPG